MRKFILWTVGIFVILLLSAIIIPFLIPSSVYKAAIEDQLTNRFGRQVTIAGDVSVSPLPVLKVHTEQVEIENPDGFTAEHFAQMESLYVRIKLLPLLSKRVEISAFELVNPTISLEKQESGEVNWLLGSSDSNISADQGSFKRDGRYSDLNASIGKFSISEGLVTFEDRQKNKSHKLTDVNLTMSVPSLSSPISARGDMIVNGIAVDAEITLKTPRSYLDGKKTSVNFNVSTILGSATAKGHFTESENNHFVFDVKGSLMELFKWSEFFGRSDISNIIETIDFAGLYSYDETGFIAKDANIAFSGPDLKSSFIGDAQLSNTLTATGDLTFKTEKLIAFASYIDMDLPSGDAFNAIDLKSMISTAGDNLIADALEMTLRGSGTEVELSGKAIIGNEVTFSGEYSADINSAADLANQFNIELESMAALGRIKAIGKLEYGVQDIKIQTDANAQSSDLTANYIGNVIFDETGANFDGQFNSTIPSLSNLALTTQIDIPYAQSIGALQANGNILGSIHKLNIQDLEVDLTQGQLNGRFDGNATYSDGLILAGTLDTEIPSARILTQTATGIELPASTATGQIYERIAMSGIVSGSPSEINFTDANLSMDAIEGGGKFTLDMTKKRPLLKGNLDLGQIDMRPYLDAYMTPPPGTEGQLQPWSEVPFDFSALKLMDGEYIIRTPKVIFGPLTFGQTDLKTAVSNGVLTARLPEVNLYGGLGVMSASLDVSGELPKITLAVTLEDIRSNRFLASLADFTRLEGNGHTVIELTGEGRTQGEIMRSLNGYGNFEVLGGLIEGIDLSKFLSGLDETLAQRILPNGIGTNYATKFDDMVGKFQIKDGVVSIESFNMTAFNVLASGGGKLDIGQQSLDFSLRPRLTRSNANDIGKFGVPLRFQGKWGSISPGPDYELLQDIAIEAAKSKAREEITERVNGELGNILGGVLGGGSNEATTPKTENTEAPAESPEKTSTETIIENPPEPPSTETVSNLPENPIVENGATERQSSQTSEIENPKQAPEIESIEEQLINEALGGIFGNKEEGGN